MGMTVSTQLTADTTKDTDEAIIVQPTKRLNKRQKDFIQNWVDPNSETFGNTYLSGIKAGYSDKASRLITANYRNLEWVKEAKQYMDNYSPMHIINGLQSIAKSARSDRDKLNALDRLAKIQGMYIERSQSEVNVSFTNSVPRPATGSVAGHDNPIEGTATEVRHVAK